MKDTPPQTPLQTLTDEASRIMTICNACRYCEGYCAVFPAMTRRLTFNAADVTYLANLCHGCRGCYYACQYAPPHEFAVNVPQTLGALRAASYEHYAWPRFMAGLYRRNGLVVGLITALSLVLVLMLSLALIDPAVLFAEHSGPGAFYRVVPHNVMAIPAGIVFLFAIVAIAIGVRRFWRDIDGSQTGEPLPAWLDAGRDTATLRYLGGGSGGDGCPHPDERPSQSRRWLHQLVLYGFLLSFASTSTATVYHYGFGWEAPYGWFSLPVVLGTLGGIGMVIGTLGLLRQSRRADRLPGYNDNGMDVAFTLLLFFTSATGLLLLALRETSWMGMLLIIHLGVVLGLFLTLPYSKFVHGIYRFAALLKNARERRP